MEVSAFCNVKSRTVKLRPLLETSFGNRLLERYRPEARQREEGLKDMQLRGFHHSQMVLLIAKTDFKSDILWPFELL